MKLISSVLVSQTSPTMAQDDMRRLSHTFSDFIFTCTSIQHSRGPFQIVDGAFRGQQSLRDRCTCANLPARMMGHGYLSRAPSSRTACSANLGRSKHASRVARGLLQVRCLHTLNAELIGLSCLEVGLKLWSSIAQQCRVLRFH